MTMKISLFGATGPTGKYLIEDALEQGYSLSVYTRDASKLEAFKGKVEIVVGDLNNPQAMTQCIQGSAAVISALGPNSLKVVGERPVMNGVANIISVMKSLDVKRLIQISTAAYRDPKDGFDFKAHAMVLVFKVLARKGLDDIKATAELIAGSGLDWTLVRIPNLKDAPPNDSLSVGWYGKTKLKTQLSRGNLARFLVSQISSRDFIRAAPAIANQ
jgi:putative NADH-flavin reductase